MTNIVNEIFFDEGVDYMGFAIMANGNQTVDFEITIDMAKELCMLTRNEKGKIARRYFIEVEKRYRANMPNFSNPAEAARAWADAYEKRVLAEEQVKEMKPKAEFHDTVKTSKDLIKIGDAAKVLNFDGIGRNKLFKILREQKILMPDNKPYQEQVNAGRFKVNENFWPNPKTGEVKISFTTLVTQKGLDYIRRRLLGLGYKIKQLPELKTGVHPPGER